MTPAISRSMHEAKYDWVVGHGPRFISLGCVNSPLLEPKKGQDIIGPTWYSREAALGVEASPARFDILSVGENGNAE